MVLEIVVPGKIRMILNFNVHEFCFQALSTLVKGSGTGEEIENRKENKMN